MYYKSKTLWEGGAYLVLSRDVMPGLLFYILGLQLCSPTKQAVPVKERNIWFEKRLHFYNVLYLPLHLRKTLFWSIMKALLWYLCICAKTIVPFLPLASPQAVQKICLKFNKKISDTWSINMIHYTSIWFDFIFLIYLVLFPITMIHVLVAWNITHCFLSCSHNIVFWHHL